MRAVLPSPECFALFGRRMQQAQQVSLPSAPWDVRTSQSRDIGAQGAMIEACARTMKRAFCG